MDKVEFKCSIPLLYFKWVMKWVLGILTLGIYSCWGKNNVRKHIIESISYRGKRLSYFGTGGDLFAGLAIIMSLVIVVTLVLSLIQKTYMLEEQRTYLKYTVEILSSLIAYAAIYSKYRYVLSRVRYGNIGFNLSGSALKYFELSFARDFFSFISLGYFAPKYDERLIKYILSNISVGNNKIESTVNLEHLKKVSVVTSILLVFTLGLSNIYYKAKVMQAISGKIKLGNLTVVNNVTVMGLLELWILNIILFFCTLGLASPYITVRNLRFYIKHMSFIGEVDREFESSDSLQSRSAIGDEFLSVYNFDIFSI